MSARPRRPASVPTVGPSKTEAEVGEGLTAASAARQAAIERGAPLVELGHAGVAHFGGILQDEIVRELQGDKAMRRYREMMLDPVVRIGIAATTERVRSLEWRVHVVGDDPDDQAAGDFVTSVLDDMDQSWDGLMDGLLTFVPFGWSWSEVVLKARRPPESREDDGLIGIRKIELRPQHTRHHWELDGHSRAVGMWQQGAAPNWSSVLIPLEPQMGSGGSLHLRNGGGGSPEGEAFLRRVFVPYYYKSEFLRFLGQGVERDVAGMPLARIPARMIEAGGAPYNRWTRLVTQIRQHRQASAVIPGDFDERGNRIFDLELLKGEGAKQFNLRELLEHLDRQILLGLGADWLLLGHGERGSWSLASERTHEHALRVAAVARAIAEAFNRVLIPRMFALNPSLRVPSRLPRLVHGDIETVDAAQVANTWNTLQLSGFPLGGADEDWVRKAIGLPPREASETL